HLKPDVKALFHPEFLLDVPDRVRRDVNGDGHVAHLACEFEAKFVDVGDNDVACTGVSCDCGRHDADRSGPGDQNVLAKHLERKRRMNRIAERIEYRCNVEVNVRLVFPDVRNRNGDVFGKAAVGVDADTARVRTQGTLPCHAVTTAAADKMPFGAYDVANREI